MYRVYTDVNVMRLLLYYAVVGFYEMIVYKAWN